MQVAADVEGGIEFPAGKADVKRRGHHTFQVAGNQRQLRLDKLDAIFESDLTLKHADTGHVEGHVLAFKMEEDGVSPGKAVTLLLMILHGRTPNSIAELQLPNHRASQLMRV